MNYRVLAVALLLILPAERAVASSFSKSARGTTTAQFLRLGVGARAIGMGEAYSTLADDASAIYWNPAALTQINGGAVTVMHALYLESISFDFVGYGQRIGSGAVGAGLQYLSAGKLPETDMAGTETGSISPSDMAASIGGAYRFGEDKFAVGIAGKYIRSQVATSASTFASDAGILLPKFRLFGKRPRISLVAANIGGKLKFDTDSEQLPMLLKAGVACRVTPSWDMAFEEGAPKDDQPYSAVGTEYRWSFNSYIKRLSLRAGFNTRTLGEVAGLTGVSLGGGIALKRFSIDYALAPIGGMGMTHRLSLAWSWGASEQPDKTEKAASQKSKTEAIPSWIH